MNSLGVNAFLSGCTATASLFAAIFFLRFWRTTGDRFFALFALAFGMLALNRASALFDDPASEASGLYVYMIRLTAFILILIAIIDKNRGANVPR